MRKATRHPPALWRRRHWHSDGQEAPLPLRSCSSLLLWGRSSGLDQIARAPGTWAAPIVLVGVEMAVHPVPAELLLTIGALVDVDGTDRPKWPGSACLTASREESAKGSPAWPGCRRGNGNGPFGREFHLVTRHEALPRNASAGDSIDAVAPMFVPIDIMGVQDDVPIHRPPQGIGLDAAGRALVVQFDEKPVSTLIDEHPSGDINAFRARYTGAASSITDLRHGSARFRRRGAASNSRDSLYVPAVALDGGVRFMQSDAEGRPSGKCQSYWRSGLSKATRVYRSSQQLRRWTSATTRQFSHQPNTDHNLAR
jgi:hypothetical protein